MGRISIGTTAFDVSDLEVAHVEVAMARLLVDEPRTFLVAFAATDGQVVKVLAGPAIPCSFARNDIPRSAFRQSYVDGLTAQVKRHGLMIIGLLDGFAIDREMEIDQAVREFRRQLDNDAN